MKKIILAILAVAITLTMLVGCGSENTNNNDVNDFKIDTNGKETKLIPDETATGNLTIKRYVDTSNAEDFFINIAVKKYKELYPNSTITIDYVDISVPLGDYCTQLATEVMVGKGPDIMFLEYSLDSYKLSKAGTLADLTEYFVNDPYFNYDDFAQGAFEAGRYNGRQYVVPLTYELPLFMSTQSLVEKSNIDLTKCTDYFSCAKEFSKIYNVPAIPEPIDDGCMYPIQFPFFSGINYIDYDNATINLDDTKLAEGYKIINENYKPLIKDLYSSGDERKIMDLLNGKSIFAVPSAGIINLAQDYEALSETEKPILVPWRNVSGGISADVINSVAVSNNCSNVENAYRFIKILLSVECGDSMNEFLVGNHVNKTALEKTINSTFEEAAARINFQKEYKTIMDDIDNFTLHTMADSYLIEELYPYLKGEKSYEECIQSAQDKLEIYISE